MCNSNVGILKYVKRYLIAIFALSSHFMREIISQDLPYCTYKPILCKSIIANGGCSGCTISEACKMWANYDFQMRDGLEEYKNCKPRDTWGPRPNTYPLWTIPDECDRIQIMQYRIVLLIKKFIEKGWNYCHHHSPSWNTPLEQRVENQEICSSDGISGEKGWNGLDCTHFTSFVYNWGFGCPLPTLTGDQTCGPNAPGRVLPFSTNQQDQFLPGDILFIAGNSKSNPLLVTHGIFWTGIKLTYDDGPYSFNRLIKNHSEIQVYSITKDVNLAKSQGKDVYVIADSSNIGPNYRIFAGWYSRAFIFARRLIDPDMSFPEKKEKATFTDNKCLVEKEF